MIYGAYCGTGKERKDKMKQIFNTHKKGLLSPAASTATIYDNTIYLSSQVAINPETGEIEKVSFKEQARRVFGNIKTFLEEMDTSMDNVLMSYVHLSSMKYFDEMNEVYLEFFKGDRKPTRLTVTAKEIRDNLDIQVSVIAVTDGKYKEVWDTDKKPFLAKISQTATISNDVIRLNGQICVNPYTGKLERESFKVQAKRAFENIKLLLEEMGSSIENVLLSNIQISSMEYFDELNEVYSEFFRGDRKPARVTVTANMWDDLDIEVAVTAAKDESKKQVWDTHHKPMISPVYQTANICNDVIYLSGQICENPITGEIEKDDFRTQAMRTLSNVKALLEEMGSSVENILIANIYLSSMKYYKELNDICAEFFKDCKPAMTVIGADIWGNLDIEVGAIALLK